MRAVTVAVPPWPHKTHPPVLPYDFPRARCGTPDTRRGNGGQMGAGPGHGSYQPVSPGYGVTILTPPPWAPPKKRWSPCWIRDASMTLVAVAVLPLTAAVTIT